MAVEDARARWTPEHNRAFTCEPPGGFTGGAREGAGQVPGRASGVRAQPSARRRPRPRTSDTEQPVDLLLGQRTGAAGRRDHQVADELDLRLEVVVGEVLTRGIRGGHTTNLGPR